MIAVVVGGNVHIGDDDLPALYRSANKASNEAQEIYLRIIGLGLWLLVFGGLLDGISPNDAFLGKGLALISAILLIFSTVLLYVNWILRKDRRWFACRAMAESVKTISWRYMMGADPYSITLGKDQVDNIFATELTALISTQKEVFEESAGTFSNQPQITASMRKLRAAPALVRKAVYLVHRIQNQQDWYSSKADDNKRNGSKFFYFVIAIQSVAIIFAFFRFLGIGNSFQLVSFMSAVAAALIAWMQVKRFQELIQSYSQAAHELGLIVAKGGRSYD